VPDEQVAALAAGVQRLTRRLDAFGDKQETLAKVVAELARAGGQPEPLPCSLDGQTAGAVEDLLDWIAGVYLQYDSAALPPCVWWHPGAVEELTVLRHIHQTVYASGDWLRIGDFHERYRPGVVRRINEALKSCDIVKHIPATETRTVPLSEALAPIAEARANNTAIPAPTAAQAAKARDLTTRKRQNNGSSTHDTQHININ
jgi:hypothetical protein